MVFAALCVSYGHTPCAGDAKNAYLQADDLPAHYACYMRMPPLFGYNLNRRYGRDAPYGPLTHHFQVKSPSTANPSPAAGGPIPFLASSSLSASSFQPTDYHPCFSLRTEDDGTATLLLTVVDNVILAGQASHVASVRSALDARSAMTWNERAEDACGLNFDYHEGDSILVHQQPYITQILARLGLADVHQGAFVSGSSSP